MTDARRKKTSDSEIIVYPNGIHYFRHGSKEFSLKTKDFTEAVKAKKRLIAKSSDIFSSSLRLRIQDISTDYEKSREVDLENGDIRTSTYNQVLLNLKIIKKHFGSVPIVKMDSAKWEAKRAKLPGNHIVNVRAVFSHFMKWCVKKGYRNTLPIFDVGRITRRKRRILKPHEMQAIWSHARGSLKLFIGHAMILGMRRSEIMTLEWDQVNFKDRAIFIPESKTKTKKDRWVTAPPSIMEMLHQRTLDQTASGIKTKWVFPNLENPRRHADKSGLKTSWNTCLRAAFQIPEGQSRPDITWHDLRATCEFYAHKRTDVSATQLEKFFGASVDVQRKIYVQGDAEFVRGVENSLSLPDVKSYVGKTRGDEE